MLAKYSLNTSRLSQNGAARRPVAPSKTVRISVGRRFKSFRAHQTTGLPDRLRPERRYRGVLVQREMESVRRSVSEFNAIFGGPACTAQRSFC